MMFLVAHKSDADETKRLICNLRENLELAIGLCLVLQLLVRMFSHANRALVRINICKNSRKVHHHEFAHRMNQ